MVRSHHNGDDLVIVATPNHSSSWRSNRRLLWLLAVPSLGAALAFTGLGAWPVLPFAGAELLALGLALYYVNWKLQYRHVITFSAESILIDKGHYAPTRRWTLPRAGAALYVSEGSHPWEGPRLSVHSNSDWISVGEFLGREDSLCLLALLRRELQLRSHGSPGQRSL